MTLTSFIRNKKNKTSISSSSSSFSSSPSSSFVAPRKYGVFLCFRGTDTRNTFVSHLHAALKQQGIPTFIDNEEFPKGREICKIVHEIQKSNVSVVILSPNYAESPWCLKELMKITECRKTQGQEVVPIFYHVDPSHVKNQTGSYGVAFTKHQADKKNTVETLQCWRNALIEVANLSGRVVIDNNSLEAQAIEDIVKDISDILDPLNPNHFQDLVGIQPKIQQVKSLLSIGGADTRVIGIWGMGGVGKTTLADALFDNYKSHFDGSCFLKHVRERSNSSGGLNQLQKDLAFDIFNGKLYTSIDKMLDQLRHKKILVVLDDVDNCRQYDEIIGKRKYGPGSRIIITSRDRQVLLNVGRDGWIYQVLALDEKESLQLFMLYALKDSRHQEWHSELSKEFVNYVKGNPLGLKILGRHLQGKNKQEWQSALCKIKEGLHKELTEVLKISFDGLDFHDKQIFLDIACFFNRNPTSEVRRILRAYYGSSVEDGLRNLADKSLVIMSSSYMDMHDLLEEMGKEVVREESRKEPGKRSRLWNHEDINQVLANDTGSEAVEGMLMVNYKESLELAPTVFAKMPKLKLLKFSPCFSRGSLRIPELPDGLEFLPKDELRQFEWIYYPLRSLPSDFIPKKLVTLDMSFSEVEQLWNGAWKFPNLHEIVMKYSKIKRLWTRKQDMPNLKIMNLSYCSYMIEMPDLSKAPKLEELYCADCVNLEEVSPSISYLSKLEKLHFQGCEKIRRFPSTVSMVCLKKLILSGCSNLIMFPEVSRNIERLDLEGADIEEIALETFRGLRSLKVLRLPYCKRLGSLPYSLHCLSSLQELDVSGSGIENIPTSIIQLSQLQKLIIVGCKRLRRLPQLPSSVCVLWPDRCESLQNVSFGPRLTPLEVPKSLKFGDHVLQFSFTNCSKLEESAREGILAFAQQSITTVVVPTLVKLVEELLPSFLFRPVISARWCRIISCFDVPGNEMPDWIKHQSGGGSSITIDFQPLNLLGFIFCAVLDFQSFGEGFHLIDDEFDPLSKDEVDIMFKVQLDSDHCMGSIRHFRSTNRRSFPVVGSQHVLLPCATYVPNEEVSQCSELSATMEIKGKRKYETRRDHSRAGVKWGLSLIYKDGDDEKDYTNDKGKRIAYADDEEEQRDPARWQRVGTPLKFYPKER